jgi:hypothetical protein
MTVQAVAQGQRTDREIAVAIGNLDPRQGRYYRRASEVLGFTQREAGNNSELTNLGRQFAQSNDAEKRSLLIQAFLGYPLVARLLQFLESHTSGDIGEITVPPAGACFFLLSLIPLLERVKLVGPGRFELPTSCTPCKRATRLRYGPF